MLSRETTEKIIDAALDGGDFAEVFCEEGRNARVDCTCDRLESAGVGTEAGVGIRVFSGTASVYAYSNDADETTLLRLAKQAASVLQKGAAARGPLAAMKDYSGAGRVDVPPDTVPYEQKLALVRRMLQAGKAYSGEISQMHVRYLDMSQRVQIANSEGLFAADTRVKTRALITAYAEGAGRLQMGYTGPGAARGFEFYDEIDVEAAAREAARVAVTMLHADSCRGGRMPVVVESGFGGLLFHEACGHSLEATAVARGLSEFCGKLGRPIGSPVVTLVDDGSLPGEWGSMHVDDEGTPTRRNVLIENGVLKSYLVDRMGARRMGLPMTGSARRQNYRFAATSRMTNTFIAPGESKAADLVAATENGLYVKNINGGSVNPATGDFNFAAAESYLIENGRLTRPVSGATLIGNGGDILQKVDMVSDDLCIRQGYCFDISGALFIGAGQPTVRVREMTVGGVE